MVVLGVAPGLSSLAYSVVSFRSEILVGDAIDCDVLHGNGQSEAAPVWQVTKAARVHQMIMGVVFDRDPPAALALGPPCDPNEPKRHVKIVEETLAGLAMALGAQVVRYKTEEQVLQALIHAFDGRLDIGERGLRKAVRCSLSEPLPSKNRRIVMATAAAVGAAYEVRSELELAEH